MPSSLELLKRRLAETNALSSAISLMGWDQQTYMPRGGAEARAEHLGLLSQMAHEIFVSSETGELLEKAQSEAESEEDRALLRVVGRSYRQSTKLPVALVAEKSRLSAQAHEAWVEAKEASDFKSFAPILERMFEIAREEAEHFGYEHHIYDALLDLYEEGATAAECEAMFAELRGPLIELVRAIQESGRQTDDRFLTGDWPRDKQADFTELLVRGIGFEMSRGRQDVAPHPFCTNFSINDVRLTTRFMPNLTYAIFGSLHEAGHGLYEQGSPQAWDRTPLAGGVSLGIHESQSRFWENIVGRSKPFWQHYLPELQKTFPQLSGVDLATFYRAINRVEPSLTRVEADEVTYNLHVLIRFEIECAILTGKLRVSDLPEAWNAKMEEYLGVTPPDDARGCLQDVHWSMGSIGYFPTYTMGNLLSFQFLAAMQQDLPETDALIAEGRFEPILRWLQEKIYQKGSSVPPKELVLQVTGKPMGASDYLAGICRKYEDIYELDRAPVKA